VDRRTKYLTETGAGPPEPPLGYVATELDHVGGVEEIEDFAKDDEM
jgi:hypothetical protein